MTLMNFKQILAKSYYFSNLNRFLSNDNDKIFGELAYNH
jgi:hypothetical protein